MYYTILWLVATIAFALVEAVTPQLVSIWLAGGAAVAFVVSIFGTQLYVQVIVFVAVSILLLALTRPFVKRLAKKEPEMTNSDANIGKIGVVTEQIDNLASLGSVRLDGLEWSAKSESGEIINVGEKVVVTAIEGVKLIVK